MPRAVIPDACKILQAVTVKPGASAQDVLEEQHRAILAYEAQIISCAKTP